MPRANYYDDSYEGSEGSNESTPGILGALSGKKIMGVSIAVLFIIILLIIAIIVLPIVRPDLFVPPKDKIGAKSSTGEDLSLKGSLTINGELVDAFSIDGSTLTEKANPRETKKIVLKTSGLSDGTKTVKAVIKLSDGRRIQLNEESVIISSDGTVTIFINPEDDLDLTDEEIEELLDGSLVFELELIIENDVEGSNDHEVLALDIPVELIFGEFYGYGCIELSRESVSETTHSGVLEVDVKVRVSCETNDSLFALVDWKTERMGNVEFLFKDFSDGSTLASNPLPIKKDLVPGTYNGKVIFTPLKDFVGQRASFDVIVGSANSEAKVSFDVALDNLEQCIFVTSSDPIIENYDDSASITIDASKCASNKIDFILCDGDPTCSFADEGGIDVFANVFSLQGLNKTKTISIGRGEIPGVYGVSVKARVPGLEKTLIDEKEILVKPVDETIIPDRYVLSLMGNSSKDSIRVKNVELSERIKIDASICSLYKSSLGITAGSNNTMGSSVSPISSALSEKTWWRKLSNTQETYAGDGKYEAALMGSSAMIDNTRQTIQQISAQKNALIKQAYLDVVATKSTIDDSVDLVTESGETATALADAAEEWNDYKNADVASQYVSIATSATSLVAGSGADCVSVVTHESASCLAAAEPKTAAICSGPCAQMIAAETLVCTQAALQAVNLVNSINSLTEETPDIDPSAALDATDESIESISEVQEASDESQRLAALVLENASVDSFSSISSDYAKTKQALMDLKNQNDAVLQGLVTSREKQLSAMDEITTLQADALSNFDNFIMWANLVDSALQALGMMGVSYVSASGLANASMQCIPTTATAEEVAAFLESRLAQTTALEISLLAISLANGAFTMWRQMTTDWVDELVDATAQYQSAMDKIDEAIVASENAQVSIDAAIEAATYLSKESAKTSDAATFNIDLTSSSEQFDKVTLTGLVASAVANGFINGAYEGGVYTTVDTNPLSSSPLTGNRNTNVDVSNIQTKEAPKEVRVSFTGFDSDMLEDCANRVKLELIDYKTNLLTDAKDVIVSNGNVLSFWSFSDPKIFGFYEQQEVGLIFVNSGLKKNGYGIVSLSTTKHTHDSETQATGTFGPFDVPDSSAQEVTYKYHFKFNATPRKAAATQAKAFCENGLLSGNSGEEALPKILLNWDWQQVTPESTKDKYLDSTQLSILVSKKISLFNEFMSRSTTSCPKNEAYDVLKSIKPTDTTITQPSCHIPLSTKTYEGKPALYYFMDSVVSPPEGYDEFFEGKYANDAERVLSLLDFNVYLMRDGLGLNFQDDFKTDYSTSILKADSTFTDSEKGMRTYFANDSRFYFSDESHGMKKATSFILPGAGLYRIKILIDYDDEDNPLISLGGSLNAKIIVNPVMIQPINEGFSPFYYTPFDGSVGLNASNNRKDYGTALSGGEQFFVSKSDGSYLTTKQKDSLAKLSFTKLSNFFWLNALPSRRGKLLEYQYYFNGTNDSNSKAIFSPTVITPMLISIQGAEGQLPLISYTLKKQNTEVKPVTNNLLLVTGLKGCKDFFGQDSTKLLNKTPDILLGQYYGIGFQEAERTGTVSVKTSTFLPTDQSYDLIFSPGGQIMTPNQLIPLTNSVKMEGIKGMKYNDLADASYISTLSDLFEAVRERSVCLSNLGDKEIYWWPEDYLSEKETSEGKSLMQKELDLRATCIK